MPKPNLPDHQQAALLYIALGDLGVHWDKRTEHRFVHTTTGQAVDVFDARVHAPLSDWRSEYRTVITTPWESSR